MSKKCEGKEHLSQKRRIFTETLNFKMGFR